VLHVGPEGAGADPGPVCYARGATQPTVTDANVMLGYMNPTAIADGTVPIDRAAAVRAITDLIAEPLGLSPFDGALGVLRVADSTMIRALRAVTIERGVDPRGVTLVGFGGSGPLHAARLAENMGIRRVYIPPFPGVLSAFGLLLADYRQDAVHSIMRPVADVGAGQIESAYREIEAKVRATLDEGGGAPGDVRVERMIEMQFPGEASTLTLAAPDLDPGGLHERLRAAFSAHYAIEYGHVRDDEPLLVAVRIKATLASSSLPISELALRTAARQASAPATRDAYFGREAGLVPTPIISRADLRTARAGPLIVEEPDTSVLIPPGWLAECDERMGIMLTRAEPAGEAA
jgi:N-methylhydantoinase A